MKKIISKLKNCIGNGDDHLLEEDRKRLTKSVKEFQCWDYTYALNIEREIFAYLADFYDSDKAHLVNAKHTAKICRILVNLLDIFLENVELSERYVNESNMKRFLSDVELKYIEECKSSEKVTKIAGIAIMDFDFYKTCLIDLYRQKAFVLYHKIRTQYMQSIWD